MKACRNCHLMTEGDKCAACGSTTSQYWSGFLGVMHPEKSEIAKIMEIKTPGKYALKVRR